MAWSLLGIRGSVSVLAETGSHSSDSTNRWASTTGDISSYLGAILGGAKGVPHLARHKEPAVDASTELTEQCENIGWKTSDKIIASAVERVGGERKCA